MHPPIKFTLSIKIRLLSPGTEIPKPGRLLNIPGGALGKKFIIKWMEGQSQMQNVNSVSSNSPTVLSNASKAVYSWVTQDKRQTQPCRKDEEKHQGSVPGQRHRARRGVCVN